MQRTCSAKSPSRGHLRRRLPPSYPLTLPSVLPLPRPLLPTARAAAASLPRAPSRRRRSVPTPRARLPPAPPAALLRAESLRLRLTLPPNRSIPSPPLFYPGWCASADESGGAELRGAPADVPPSGVAFGGGDTDRIKVAGSASRLNRQERQRIVPG